MKLIQPSTQAFFREARQMRHFSWFDRLHGYFYARWPYLYISLATGEHRLARTLRPLLDLVGRWITPAQPKNTAPGTGAPTFADTYHGKVVPLEAARELVSVHQEISLSLPEKIIPYMLARDIIFKNPDHIVALDCPCRAARPNPCLPLDVCLIIGEPFAGFVMEHTPQKARWITSEQAYEILKAEDERGHVHHAFFKDAMLGRFYAICNCCACCCGAMQAQRNGVPMLASSGYVAQVDADRCQGCGSCDGVCQFGALSRAEVTTVDASLCMGCGVCVSHCPHQALSLQTAPQRGEPLEIFRLMEEAAHSS